MLKWYLAVDSSPKSASLSLAPDGTLYVPVCQTIDSGAVSALWAVNPARVDTNDANYPSPVDFVNWVTNHSGSGFEVTPAVGLDGTLYTSIDFNIFAAINPTNGSTLWSLTVPAMGNFYPLEDSPAIDKNGTVYLSGSYFVYAITNDYGHTNVIYTTNLFYGSENIYSHSFANAGAKWIYAYPNVAGTAWEQGDTNFAQTGSSGTGGFLYSSPAIGADGTVYFNTDFGQLVALNPTNGLLKWVTSQLSVSFASSPPAIGSDGTIYWGSKNYFFAIDPNAPVTNEVIGYKWTYQAPSQESFLLGPVIGSDGTVYVEDCFGADNHLFALDPKSGSPRWTNNLGNVVFDPGKLKKGSLAIATDGEIYTADMDGRLFSFAALGTTNWIFDTSQYVQDTSYLGSPLIGPDGTIYVSTYNFDQMTCYVFAFAGASPVACSSWPELGKNARRTAAVASTQASPQLMTTNGFRFNITGKSNMPVCPCASSDLINWTNIGEIVLTNGTASFMDTQSSNFPYRFYRTFSQ